MQLLGELIDVPPEERPAWLTRRLPDAPEEHARLLAAVVDDPASDAEGATDSASGSAPLKLAVPTAAASHVSLPVTIDRYEVLGLLGHGGMGTVYLARDPLMDRQVAVKVLGIAGGLEYRQRFLREARAAGGLRHRNIVTIYDVGEAEQGPFIVMERIPGRTLHELLAAGHPSTLSARLTILEDVCAALEAAHHAGVVHRDIKPSNVMVDQDDVVKVLDFGVAKPLMDAAALTKDRLVVGTAGYMSPEQAAAGAVDARSDVYSIAVLAYEFLTSHRPFEPHVSALAPALAAILRRGMATLPAERYQSAAALGRALADFKVQALAEEANPTLASADLDPARGASLRHARREPAGEHVGKDQRTPHNPSVSGAGTSRAVMAAAMVAAVLVLAAIAWLYLVPRMTSAAERAVESPPIETPVAPAAAAAAGRDAAPAANPGAALERQVPAPPVVRSPEATPRPGASTPEPAARRGTPSGAMSAACRALLAQTSLGEPLTESQRSTWERDCVS